MDSFNVELDRNDLNGVRVEITIDTTYSATSEAVHATTGEAVRRILAAYKASQIDWEQEDINGSE